MDLGHQSLSLLNLHYHPVYRKGKNTMILRKIFIVTWVSSMVPELTEFVGGLRNPEVSTFFKFKMGAIWEPC